MTKEESYSFLVNISYNFGNMGIEYLTEKDGEKMREAVDICMQESFEEGKHDGYLYAKADRWIPVSERLPKDFGTYLITLEGGDMCKCRFNPDFIDEEHENGAFTFCYQYFDPVTLGVIDEEEEAVDAIAWMSIEPYEPQEGSGK